MAGDGKGHKTAAANPGRFAFNPLWLVDAAGALGFTAFVAGAVLPVAYPATPVAAPLREAGLLFVGCWLVVRSLEALLHHRDGRDGQRRELLRRLAVLNDALLELRKSLSRDNTRRFLDRRAEYAAGLKLAKPALTPKELDLARACGEFCDRMAKSLAETVHRRADVAAAVDRLRREIERAARRGDLDQHDADDLIDIMGDAVAVLDEAIYAEWNADHFGRLTADQRHFARELDRYKSQAAGEIERRGRDLFDQLLVHVRQKVEVVDQIQEWDEVYRKLEVSVAGLPAPKATPLSAKAKPAEKPKPRASERFPMLVVRNEDGDELLDDPRPRLRLPAAND
jgi:hypothetical protein